MYLISSKIVTSDQDSFWQALPKTWNALEPRPCLVLTRPYATGTQEEQTLLKMLSACKLSPDQYHILPIEEGGPVAWHKLRNHFNPKYALLLGISPALLGISALLRLHDANAYDGCTFIPALSLQEMERHAEAKKEFWLKGLKPVFAP